MLQKQVHSIAKNLTESALPNSNHPSIPSAKRWPFQSPASVLIQAAMERGRLDHINVQNNFPLDGHSLSANMPSMATITSTPANGETSQIRVEMAADIIERKIRATIGNLHVLKGIIIMPTVTNNRM